MEWWTDRRLDYNDVFLIGPAVVTPLAERWKIAASEVIDWHEWGDEFVVRVAGRAETHLLSPAAGSVLLALLDSRSPMTLEAIYARACGLPQTNAANNASISADERNLLRSVVAEFERLGVA